MKRILVIRLGALGDFVLSFPAFAAIRAHHATDHITLLTTPPFVSLALDSPWFDQVRTDTKPAWFEWRQLARLRRQLQGFDFIYDLQTSGRSSRYFLLAGRPAWSGIARGCSHPHRNPRRNDLHTVERQREQLADAGVSETAAPDLSWLTDRGPDVPPPYALLVIGTSASHGGAKRWPPPRFSELACEILARGYTPVLIGGSADTAAAEAIRQTVPESIDLTGRTSLQDVAGLAARAAFAVGGDTGPIHLAAAMGCPVVAMFSRFSNPALAAPRGKLTLLAAETLAELPVARVVAALPQG
jgi:ADP-heptose:LPS heptosyltransferase